MMFDKLAWQRERRKKTQNSATKKYEKTIRGYIMRTYRNMLSRTQGLVKPELYKGLSIMSKSRFYAWSLNDKHFGKLYKTWVTSGYDRRLSPSINRKDSAKGYDTDNVEWVTQSDNSSFGAISKNNQYGYTI